MTNRLDRDFHLPGLLRFALPTIIMMLVVSLYTIVDGVLIARLVGENALAAANVANYSLSNFDAVCQVAADEGKIRPEDIERLKKFRSNPSDESWITSK